MPAEKLCLDDFRNARKALVVQDAVNILRVILD